MKHAKAATSKKRRSRAKPHADSGPVTLADAIAAHREAMAIFQTVVSIESKMFGDNPLAKEVAEKSALASTAEEDAARALCAFPCRTIEEVRAKANYIAASPLLSGRMTEQQVELLVGSFADGEPGAGGAKGQHDDAELVALGAEFERAWDVERPKWAAVAPGTKDDVVLKIMAPCRVLSERILRLPAHTLVGLRIKARAILWCHNGELDVFGHGEATDEKLAESIVRDLLALSIVSEAAI